MSVSSGAKRRECAIVQRAAAEEQVVDTNLVTITGIEWLCLVCTAVLAVCTAACACKCVALACTCCECLSIDLLCKAHLVVTKCEAVIASITTSPGTWNRKMRMFSSVTKLCFWNWESTIFKSLLDDVAFHSFSPTWKLRKEKKQTCVLSIESTCKRETFTRAKLKPRGFKKQHDSLPSGSHFGQIRSRNQSAQAVSLHRPPSVLTPVSDNHNVATRHWELVVSLNRDRRAGVKTPSLRREQTHCSGAACSSVPEPQSRRWPWTPRCIAVGQIAREPRRKVHPTFLLRTDVTDSGDRHSTRAACKATHFLKCSTIVVGLRSLLAYFSFALIWKGSRCTKDVRKTWSANECLPPSRNKTRTVYITMEAE